MLRPLNLVIGLFRENAELYDLDPITIIASIVLNMLSQTVGLAPPLAIRYAILKRPMDKWPAIGTSAFFWLLNLTLFIALGSQSKTHNALILVAFVSYWILRKAGKTKEQAL